MNKIILLPPEVSQKIAAGEVVERPFSVVKELVENSLDAGASEIKVELVEGGKELIRITDNGCGMSREDALICFQRHSTSKISSDKDLAGISTLGFRGEALPSISAVSRVILKSADGQARKGTLIEREGEETLRVQDTAFPRGTCVEVRDLFFNLPARKKFLRTGRSELGSIVKFLIPEVLAYPEVRFSLYHGKREVFAYPPVGSLQERIYQVYGKSLLDRLMLIDFKDASLRLFGYVSRPPLGRTDRTHQFFYVNKRPVKDRILQSALNQAFRNFLEKDHYPEAFLFLSIPYAEVDVNVHPAKAEIRFRDSHPVFRLMHLGIEQAALREMGIKEVYPQGQEQRLDSRVKDAGQPFFSPAQGKKWQESPGFFFPQTKEEGENFRVLGQYLETYIVVTDAEGILVVDQHNAHERILFEKYLEIDKKRSWPRKLALLPLLMELSPSQILSLEQNETLLEGIGFQVEAMGGRTFALKEYPDLFMDQEAEEAFLQLLEDVTEGRIEERKKKILATLACRTAVKAGALLSSEKMRVLVEELLQTANSSLCPHGRPVTIRISRGEIEKALKRK